MFVERKVAGRLSGGEKLRQFKALCGWNILQETVSCTFTVRYLLRSVLCESIRMLSIQYNASL